MDLISKQSFRWNLFSFFVFLFFFFFFFFCDFVVSLFFSILLVRFEISIRSVSLFCFARNHCTHCFSFVLSMLLSLLGTLYRIVIFCKIFFFFLWKKLLFFLVLFLCCLNIFCYCFSLLLLSLFFFFLSLVFFVDKNGKLLLRTKKIDIKKKSSQKKKSKKNKKTFCLPRSIVNSYQKTNKRFVL